MPHELVCVGPYGWSSRDLFEHDRSPRAPAASCTSPATCRSTICRSSTTSASSSSSRRSTKASVCRSSKRWRAARRSSRRTRRRSSEIAAGAAETIDPYDVEALTRRDRRGWRATPSLAARARGAGLGARAEFSWARTAREMLAVYQRAAGVASQPAPRIGAPIDVDRRRDVRVTRSRRSRRCARAGAPATLAFDRLAPEYDALAGGEIFQLLRRRDAHRVSRAGSGRDRRVLEIGCGTGLDTAFLAARGMHVVACDPSEEMVEPHAAPARARRARRPRDGDAVRAAGPRSRSSTRSIEPEGFDGIVSNFGALNCVEHLAPLGALATRATCARAAPSCSA